MAPKRIKNTGFETRAAFDAALDDIASMSVEQRKLEAERDEKLQAIQEEYNEDIKEIGKKIKGTVAQAEKYVLSHRTDLFPTARKRGETALSKYGLRLGQPKLALLNRKWKWATVLTALEDQSLPRFITVKESPNKDEMKAKLTAEQLASVGCKITQAEEFWVAPKLEDGETLG